MKPIPTKIHGVLDYVTGAALIMAPAIFNFPAEGAAGRLPLILGVAVIVYSLFTRYEWGLIKAIPMPVHLGLDLMSGVLLAASPWLFGFSDVVWMPHFFVGILEIAAAMLTQRVPRQGSVAHPPADSPHAA